MESEKSAREHGRKESLGDWAAQASGTLSGSDWLKFLRTNGEMGNQILRSVNGGQWTLGTHDLLLFLIK